MNALTDPALLDAIMALAKEAGERILEVKAAGMKIAKKADRSTVTEADEAADRMIVAGLAELTPEIPVISEEGQSGALTAETFWLVDPLDGTNGFARGGKEYTVNIGLIHRKKPVMGAVYLPETEENYGGIVGVGAWKEKRGKRQEIRVRRIPRTGWTVLISHRHASGKVYDLLEGCPVKKLIPASSSLKFCWIAEGKAELYPRLGPTSEWDSAAGHAVVQAAGGEVYDLTDLQPLRYGKPEVRNGPFLVCGGVQDKKVIARFHGQRGD